jgi:hypothetical protein
MLCLASLAAGGDEPVRVTVFELTDGRKVEAFRHLTFSSGGIETYTVTTLDGQRVIVQAKDVRLRKEELVPLARLPEAARDEVRRARAAAAAAIAQAQARAAAQQAIVAARRAELEVQAAADRIRAELAQAGNLIAKTDVLLKSLAVEIAEATARYDGAKTELGGSRDSYGLGFYEFRRADYLRRVMERAAGDKAAMQIQKEAAEQAMARAKEAMQQLGQRVDSAQRNVDAAKADVRKAVMRAKSDDDLAVQADSGVIIGRR